MTISPRGRGLVALFALLMTFSMVAVDHADARRGGSFGSRGARTFQAPPATATVPKPAAPVERTMSPRPAQNQPGAAAAPAAQRPGFFNGFGGSMLRGLALGGLIGLLLGSGFGGMAGLFGLLLQVGLLALGVMLVMRLLRRNTATPAAAGMPGAAVPPLNRSSMTGTTSPRPAADRGPAAYASASAATVGATAPGAPGRDDVGITGADFDRFEQSLAEVQAAYGREDFAALRRLTTPEVMGYFAEELGRNATEGRRNEVSAVKLLQGDLAESWREGSTDYATVALRYESIDVVRDRATGAVVSGDPVKPTETAEIWTFRRDRGADWQLSAIQDAADLV